MSSKDNPVNNQGGDSTATKTSASRSAKVSYSRLKHTNTQSSASASGDSQSSGASDGGDSEDHRPDIRDETMNRVPPAIDNIDIPDDPFGDEYTDRRLWVGNLDSRMTEYAVLKLVQKHGSIRKMDFVYHKSGPEKGKPKGYCFVSFQTWEAAEEARKALDGKFALGRPLYVKWARGVTQTEESKVPVASVPSVSSLANSKAPVPIARSSSDAPLLPENASKDAKIRAIEAKLKLMESTQREFSADSTIRAPPGWVPPSSLRKDDRSRPGPYKKSSSGGHRNRRR